MYEADSLVKRSPTASTTIEKGKERSDSTKPWLPSGPTVPEPHQASSISSSAAPTWAPRSMAVPRSPSGRGRVAGDAVVFQPPLPVTGEAAGREHDAAPRTYARPPPVPVDRRARDGAVLHDQLHDRRRQPHGSLLGADDAHEGAAQGAAQPDQALAGRQAAQRAEDEARAADEPADGGPGPPQQPHVVGHHRRGKAVGGASGRRGGLATASPQDRCPGTPAAVRATTPDRPRRWSPACTAGPPRPSPAPPPGS